MVLVLAPYRDTYCTYAYILLVHMEYIDTNLPDDTCTAHNSDSEGLEMQVSSDEM